VVFGGGWVGYAGRSKGVTAKIVISLAVVEVGDGGLEGVEHAATLFRVNLAGGEAVDDHGQRLLDGLGVVQGMHDLGAEAGAGADGRQAGSAEPLVVVAEGAGAKGGRLAAASVGFGVAADGVLRVLCVHLGSLPGLNAEGRKFVRRMADAGGPSFLISTPIVRVWGKLNCQLF
jgi:hypothetical protein